jgi:hypothetical protein
MLDTEGIKYWQSRETDNLRYTRRRQTRKEVCPALDNYGQRCFVRSDLEKMKCVCKTQMMPPPDYRNLMDMYTSIMCINILQNIKAVALKL